MSSTFLAQQVFNRAGPLATTEAMKLRALNMRIPERLAVRLKIKAARRESSVKEIASDALATYLRNQRARQQEESYKHAE
jgi:predicted HicB family RNase H-like nuclease